MSIIARSCLIPSQLSINYKEILLENIKNQWEHICHPKIGYIFKIIEIEKIIHEKIMRIIPNVQFTIKVKVESYYPKIGDHIPIKIHLIFNNGIFGYFHKLRILIPYNHNINNLNWSIKQDFSGIFIHHQDNWNARQNETIIVELKQTRYEKDTFSCIAYPLKKL